MPAGEEEVGRIGAIGLDVDASGESAKGGGLNPEIEGRATGEDEGGSSVPVVGLDNGEIGELENGDGADPYSSGSAPGEEEGGSIVGVGLDGIDCCMEGEGAGDIGRSGLFVDGDRAGLIDGDSMGEGEVLRSRRDSGIQGLKNNTAATNIKRKLAILNN